MKLINHKQILFVIVILITSSTSYARYLQPDPLGQAAGDVNVYSYVGQNPVNYVDPDGLSRKDVEKLNKITNEVTQRLTKEKKRRDGSGETNAILNDILSSDGTVGNINHIITGDSYTSPIPAPNYEMCYDQAEEVLREWNEVLRGLDDPWIINLVGGKGHYWAEAVSGNKNDPVVVADPLKNNPAAQTASTPDGRNHPWTDKHGVTHAY
jgi:hypothetical protein